METPSFFCLIWKLSVVKQDHGNLDNLRTIGDVVVVVYHMGPFKCSTLMVGKSV